MITGFTISASEGVSIHIHPEGRMKLIAPHVRTHIGDRVSIHIHPEGRMKPLLCSLLSRSLHSFNPHPPRRADETRPAAQPPCGSSSFNPHPPRRADETNHCESESVTTSTFQSTSTPKGG